MSKFLDKIGLQSVITKIKARCVVKSGDTMTGALTTPILTIGSRADGKAVGSNSYGQGTNVEASAARAHAEGNATIASADSAHAEGASTQAIAIYAHAEGQNSRASGSAAHAEGRTTTASGANAHAEGYSTSASGYYAHAEGLSTTAQRQAQHTEGKYNILDTGGASASALGTYVHIVGNGTSPSARSNAHTLDWEGNAWYEGNVYIGSTSGINKDGGSKKLATEDYVDAAVESLPEPMVFRGSLGTNGTITSLPVDGTSNIGDTYKVITAGTYAGETAKVGDTFICLTKTEDSNTWELIPSGDEPSGTVTSVGATTDANGALSISGSPITSSGTLTINHKTSDVVAGVYKSVNVDTYGHVIAGSNPTTLGGYGITDANINNGVITLGANTITPVTDISGKVNKSGDTMTGALIISSGALQVSDGDIIKQSDYPNNHALKMGRAGDNVWRQYEYGGVFEFYQSQQGTDTLLGKIDSNGWVGTAQLTGTPTAPTANSSTNNTQIATTAFVQTIGNTKQNQVTYSTTDLTEGSSPLATGEIYLVYES